MKLPKGGFTLFEILIVVVLLGLTVFPLFFYSRQVSQTQAIRTSVSVLADTLQEAKNSSRDARNQSAWGVIWVDDTTYKLVYGDQNKNTLSKNVALEDGVTVKDPFQVWFEIGTGNVDSSKTINLTNSLKSNYEITVSETGVINTKQL